MQHIPIEFVLKLELKKIVISGYFEILKICGKTQDLISVCNSIWSNFKH